MNSSIILIILPERYHKGTYTMSYFLRCFLSKTHFRELSNFMGFAHGSGLVQAGVQEHNSVQNTTLA